MRKLELGNNPTVVSLAKQQDGKLIDAMAADFPKYQAAAKDFTVDHNDVREFTRVVLLFYKNHGKEFPAWAKGARIIFALSCSSAPSERVFSLMKLMFGEQQLSALADFLQAALMLRFNKRL